MIERVEQRPIPGLEEREILESMGAEALVDHILVLGERVTHLETKMNIASDILEGVYGVTVEDVLSQRSQTSDVGETKNEQSSSSNN